MTPFIFLKALAVMGTGEDLYNSAEVLATEPLADLIQIDKITFTGKAMMGRPVPFEKVNGARVRVNCTKSQAAHLVNLFLWDGESAESVLTKVSNLSISCFDKVIRP